MKLVEVFGVRVEMPGNQPIVLLREVSGDRYLPIWVGSAEASAISLAQQGIEAARPLTIDLLIELLDQTNTVLKQIEVSKLIDGIFYADLVFEDDKRISARPSDAIALALKLNIPIFSAESVLNQAGIAIAEEPDSEAELEKFREFLDQINPEDFS
jgi:bifunctional DNase/RNase